MITNHGIAALLPRHSDMQNSFAVDIDGEVW